MHFYFSDILGTDSGAGRAVGRSELAGARMCACVGDRFNLFINYECAPEKTFNKQMPHGPQSRCVLVQILSVHVFLLVSVIIYFPLAAEFGYDIVFTQPRDTGLKRCSYPVLGRAISLSSSLLWVFSPKPCLWGQMRKLCQPQTLPATNVLIDLLRLPVTVSVHRVIKLCY